MNHLVRILSDLPFPVLLEGIPALELYYEKKFSGFVRVFSTASLIECAHEFEHVQFPACDFADIVVKIEDPSTSALSVSEFAISCIDSFSDLFHAAATRDFMYTSFFHDPQKRRYLDPLGMYPLLRERRISCDNLQSVRDVMDLALLVARLGFEVPHETRAAVKKSLRQYRKSGEWQDVSNTEQRYILMTLLAGGAPQAGLSILKDAGFLQSLWPELNDLVCVEHTKEYHPEGDVWEHTLETLKYRKTRDMCLSLGLLLHDCGKPKAGRVSGNQFDRHAQIGAVTGRRFLERLGFDRLLIDNVCYLIENHMLPAFISRMPVSRTGKVMSSTLFPVLLELYRCDLSSSFRSPDDYYSACKSYRAYLKNSRNPFRSVEGKKLLRLYVDG